MRVSSKPLNSMMTGANIGKPRQRNAGKVETIYGTKRFMSVATINKMNKASLEDWLFQRGFMPEAFETNKERKECLIEDLKGELNAG